MSLEYDNRIGFDRVLDAFEKKVRHLALLRVRRLARQLFKKIVYNTPVLSGRLRASWKLSLGEALFTVEEPPKQGWSHQQAANIAMQQADNLHFFKDPKTQKILITNGTPYADRIEDGYSEKAPVGILQTAIQSVQFLAGEGAEEGGEE